jgi:asparagine synthase (glutamine-hydrolysing)
MSIYAFADIEDGIARKINASVRFPSRQEGNIFFDGEHSINLKYADELPIHVENFFVAIAFRASHILLSRDVIGAKPLYYNPFELAFSSFKSYFNEQPIELLPGEVLKLDYDGSILSKKLYKFDDVFPKSDQDVEELVQKIDETLNSFSSGHSCLAFSGGVDSSLLASLYDVELISVTASQQEKEWVKKAAKMLGKEIKVLTFDEGDVREILPDVISAIEMSDTLQVSIAIPIYLALKFAKELGYSNMIFGQGADELFGGYKRYESMNSKLGDVLHDDVRNIGRNNLVRDTKLAYRLEMNILTPYLQWDIIKAAINIPVELKVRKVDGIVIRKFILRELASRYIPKELAYRDKKAVQYSTKTHSILLKLARKEGMKIGELLGLQSQESNKKFR